VGTLHKRTAFLLGFIFEEKIQLFQSGPTCWNRSFLLFDMAFVFSIPTALAGVVAYFIARYTYRFFFHPLSAIPGPTFAAISYLPEFYHDVVRKGMYMWEIEKMHQKYGR
jgi:hypothetical protein